MTFFIFNKGLSGSTGSFSKTSRPAPAMSLSLRALISSGSSIIPPRGGIYQIGRRFHLFELGFPHQMVSLLVQRGVQGKIIGFT